MNSSISRASIALCVAAILATNGVATAKNAGSLAVAPGATQVISRTLTLTKLTIGEGATLAPAAGHSLTLTVNGVGTTIKPGSYSGRVVLTPTENVYERFNDMGVDETYPYRAALFIDNGKRVPAKSVSAAIVGGDVNNTSASNISITSKEDKFNGIFITGDSKYTLNNPKITFTGNGANDFVGFGAAIKTAGTARVVINYPKIDNTGVVRTAIFVGGHSDVTVNHADIFVHNGVLPANYRGGPITGSGGVMMEPPWVMGIVGNVRATNVVGNGTVHYNNSHIRAQAWGALSTDATADVHLYATHSVIETVESGYGAYADGTSLDTFSDCTFKVADYGLIMTGGSGVFTDHSTVTSGRFGVMMHSGGHGTLTIEKGSVFNTQEAVIQVKSSYPKIVVNDAKLNSASGMILEAIINDDPHAGAGAGIGFGGPPPGGAPPAAAAPATIAPKVIAASFSKVALNGDIVNAMTSLANMTVAFENASITGGISTTTAKIAGATPTATTYKLIGRMAHAFGAVQGSNGLEVSLDGSSKWVVSKTSYLTGLTLAEGAALTAPEGASLSMTVDGKDTPVRAGTYKGAVVLKVSRS